MLKILKGKCPLDPVCVRVCVCVRALVRVPPVCVESCYEGTWFRKVLPVPFLREWCR